MSQPVVAEISPIGVELKKGKEYYFCTCGRSSGQPFCDGSHADTGFTPQAFTAEGTGEAFLCRCKHTKNPPYCDGSHAQFDNDDIGQEGPISRENEGSDDNEGSGDSNDSKSDNTPPTAKNTTEEPTVEFIHQLAKEGLSKTGSHGPVDAMGVPGHTLPQWDDIQLMTAQLATKPLMEDAEVSTELVIGPEAKKPLTLKTPLMVSDMSFGALSQEAKVALAKGADMAGTGICSGEGGMLPEEQAENSRYFYELASAKFGYDEALLAHVQAFHFKAGQAAKTGTGGHLPANKNTAKIAQVRNLEEGTAANSPPAFEDLSSVEDFQRFAGHVRELTGGIPVGFKLSANHIERDIQFALDAGADYLILDGRGGGTGAAPTMFRDHISVPTIPALARARRYLDQHNASGRVTLIVTGGLRVPMDYVKALALGADGIALANSAIQAIGCVGARMCHTNLCPAGIATQDETLRKRLDVDAASKRLYTFLNASTELMQVMARACGHSSLSAFNLDDLATWNREMADLSGVSFAGVNFAGMPQH
ncbi:glutamate synthase-related protein [Halomonas vilamensis]|uniref:Glutamate synthase-related protein n=1 Tax=Vreelandella vilamensis TaxID=531309 RepID=A0ABU1GZY7_9GAMM|nr:glutamate synthase-related protein [Halomonas vilamensis]MDR5897619.1 glutamate synthase-related protein [Halomonas vilamensis]